MDNLQPRSPVSPHQVGYFYISLAIDWPRLTEVFYFSGNSPSSTPVSAKSPGPEEEEQEPPQLSVKREFSLASAGGGKRENSEGAVVAVNEEEEDSQQNNLLDCLVQAQNFAIQQAASGNKNFENNINNFPSGHLMQGELH